MKCANESCDREAREGRGTAGRFCGPACRREAYTLEQLRAGNPSGGYRSVDAFLGRRKRRGNSARAGVVSGA